MIEFLSTIPLALLVILIIALFGIIIVLLIVAIKQGREFSLWPLKIGPRIEKLQEKQKSLAAFENFGIVKTLSSLEEIPKMLEAKEALNFKRIRVLARSWHSTIKKLEDTLPKFRDTDIYILILNPDSIYVDERVKENPFDTIEKVKNEIYYSINKLKEMKQKYSLDRFHVKKYYMLPIFRMTIIDDFIFFSYYPKAASGTTVPVFQIKKQEPSFYQALERHFEFIWRISQEVF